MRTREKTEKVCVTIPSKLVKEIRSIVIKGEISSFFTEALEFHLAHHKQQIALEQGFGAWKDENHPDLVTPEDTLNYVNALREVDNRRFAEQQDDNAK